MEQVQLRNEMSTQEHILPSPVYSPKEIFWKRYSSLESAPKEFGLVSNQPSLNTIVKVIKDGFLILWQSHGIFTAKIENKNLGPWVGQTDDAQIELDFATHLERMRAFSEQCEYHFYRVNGEIRCRLIIDHLEPTEGLDAIEAVDTPMLLRGGIGAQLNLGNNVSILTRNYLGIVDGQSSYVDQRFVNFQPNSK